MASTSNGGPRGGSSTAPKRGVTKVAPQPGEPKEDRDPNHLNSHIVVDYYSVFGEQERPRSFDCTWEFSELCYDLCYDCLYTILTTLCGCWIALYWGLQMVPVIFTHVWCLTPIYVLAKNICGNWCGTCWYIFARACIAPWTKACAPFFRHCGNGLGNMPKTPPIFQSGKRSVKRAVTPVVQRDEPETVVVVPVVPDKKHFDDYDKTKIANSVRRQMMLV